MNPYIIRSLGICFTCPTINKPRL